MSRGRSWQALFAEFLVIVVGVLAALGRAFRPIA
jgi:hypothetical protein